MPERVKSKKLRLKALFVRKQDNVLIALLALYY